MIRLVSRWPRAMSGCWQVLPSRRDARAVRTEYTTIQLSPLRPSTPRSIPVKSPIRYSLCLAILAASCLTVSARAHAQGTGDVEAKFIAMLKNATLKGTWAPVAGGQLGKEKGDDTYKIARVEKKEGEKWSVVSVFNFQGQEMQFPIPCTVKFAGDTAVLILDNVRAGPGKANWSARVMFFDDVYAGRWWETANKEHGGTIAGTITRTESASP